MKRSSVLLIALTAVTVLLCPNVSFAIGIEVAVGVWGQGPSGDISYKSDLTTDKLDIEEDLKYDRKYKPFGRVRADMPGLIPNIYFIATPMKFEETGSKTTNFTFGDTTFDVTLPFDTLVQLNHYDIALFYSLPFVSLGSAGKLNADLGLNARIVDFKAEVSGTDLLSNPIVESEEFTLPVPMIYLGLQIKPIDILALEGEFRGIAYNSNHYYDFIGRVKGKPLNQIFVAAGYRYEDVEIDESDVKASISFSGPFFEAGMEF
ncbi:MAG: TIGR04219 family outer membrane beta-barrel protein [Nitrospiraceae bacterium]|nr:MAG: TIGR04219 family outer membrane beta-barrel protein [Nitrospiraceae bacterium]